MEWPLDPEQGLFGPMQRVVIELKLLRGRMDNILPRALEQTAASADTAGAEEFHLVVFDRRPEVAWGEKGLVDWVRGMGDTPQEIRLVHGEKDGKRGLKGALDGALF